MAKVFVKMGEGIESNCNLSGNPVAADSVAEISGSDANYVLRTGLGRIATAEEIAEFLKANGREKEIPKPKKEEKAKPEVKEADNPEPKKDDQKDNQVEKSEPKAKAKGDDLDEMSFKDLKDMAIKDLKLDLGDKRKVTLDGVKKAIREHRKEQEKGK